MGVRVEFSLKGYTDSMFDTNTDPTVLQNTLMLVHLMLLFVFRMMMVSFKGNHESLNAAAQ